MLQLKKITDENILAEALNGTKSIIFKHSTRCPISASAHQQVEKFCQTCTTDVTVYIVDVIAERPISQKIAERTGIVHHSPEVIFIEDGKVTGHLTHWDIQMTALEREVNK